MLPLLASGGAFNSCEEDPTAAAFQQEKLRRLSSDRARKRRNLVLPSSPRLQSTLSTSQNALRRRKHFPKLQETNISDTGKCNSVNAVKP